MITLILISLFRARQVTSNTIYGAVSIYLLIGMSFSVLYVFMGVFIPGSFYIDEAHNPGGRLELSAFIYFSFTTLTTLGYGDITPISSYARSATNLEAVMGILYVAILISRFVGIYIAQSAAIDKKKDV